MMRVAKTMMTALRLTLSEITAHSQRDYVSLPARLRLTISMLLMLVLGSVNVWGQETTDYSGVYYIGSNGYSEKKPTENYYLCPTEGWCFYQASDDFTGTDNGMPFLTTYQCRNGEYDASKAVWVISKAPNSDYYYIKQKSTGSYLVANGIIQTTNQGWDRMRVHLESIADPVAAGDKVLFNIYVYSGYKVIQAMGINDPSSYSGHSGHDAHKWLTVNGGNYNFLTGQSGKGGGPTGYTNTAGILGLYTENDNNAKFYLEDYIQKPTIFYNTSNEIQITVQDDATIIYTTDGSDPTDPNNSNRIEVNNKTTTFTIDEIKTIKAVAVVSGFLSKEIAVFTPPVLLGNTNKYLIQSQNNGWTIDESTTDFHFYMVPGDSDNNGVTRLTTTSLFCPSMEWYFLSAGMENGVQFYYFINATGNYLCYDNSVVYMAAGSDDNIFKFNISVSSGDASSFQIIPYALRDASKKFINRTGTNGYWEKNTDSENPLNLADNDSPNTRWKFVSPNSLDTTAPFKVSNTTSAYYYKIGNVGASGYYIIPPTGVGNATVSNSDDPEVIKTMNWYFEEVSAPSTSPVETGYYHIRNAITGDYLYFTDANNDGACLATSSTITAGSEDRYQFIWAKTADANVNYYIIPKLLKDASLNQFSVLRKGDNTNTTISTNTTRGAGNYAWTFTLFCNDPVFEEKDGSITISCVPDITRIYYTTNGTEPNPTDENQRYNINTPPFSASDQLLIKAIAFVSDGTNTASSSVITLLNKPDISLDTESYTYNGTACEPGVTSVSIGETIAPTSPATYTWEYSDNVNAGTATVNIVDNLDDKYYIWGSTTFTINPAGVTLTANSGTKTYDGTEQTVNGFTSELTFEGVSASGSGTNKGEYPVTFTGVTIGTTKDASGNYVVTGTTDGTLTISPKQLTITADSETKVYDGTLLTKNSYTNTEIIASDHIESVTVTGSQTDVGTSNNVPSAAVIKNSTDDDVTANYDITYTNGTLEVTKKPLTVTADAKSKAYGEADPTLTYSSEGLINDDAITGTLSREAGDDVGTYAITQGDLTAGNNYEIVFNSANLTITQVELTITANDRTITYGDAPAGNGVTYSGFIGTEDESVLSGTLDYDFSYTQYGDVGNAYTITPKGLTSNNYNITFTSGYLTVTAKTVGIDWTDTELTYNGNEQIPTATATGLVISDEIGVTVTGAQTNVGNYTATASALTGDKAGNYELPNDNTHSFTISGKSIGNDTTPADGFTLEFDEDGNIILKSGDHILTKGVDYTIGEENIGEKYSTRNISGTGNYTGSITVKNAIVPFTTDNNQYEWTSTFVAESSGIGHALPEGVMAFIISGIQGEWAIAKPLDYIPAGVPVLLVAREAKNGFLVKDANPVTEISDDQKEANMLEVVSETTPGYDAVTQSAPFATKQIYLLYKNEFVFNKAGNLKKGRVYLNPNHHPALSASAPARLMISWTIPTDVQSLPDGRTEIDKEEVWYTIDGRRLDRKPNAKGLYIVNGKKIVVK